MGVNIQIKNTTEDPHDTPRAQEQPCEKKKAPTPSELRQDLISGDWVVIATGRAKRPDEFARIERAKDEGGIEKCLFEDPVASGQEPDVLIYHRSDGEWTLRVFPNKFPAFSHGKFLGKIAEGPYHAMAGKGYHELVVTRDHYKQLALMNTAEVAEVFDAYQERYLEHMKKKGVNYVAVFHNHGKEAGASIAHPHSQIMAIPVVAPYNQSEIDGAEKYWKSHHHCAYCVMAEYEMEQKKRVVYENDQFIAFCPFASRAAFEMWVMPKKHSPYFERITDEEKVKLAEVFQRAMKSLYGALNDPAYNFYIHTSPCDGKDYRHYHWHIEILPHTSTWAGFELDTGIEVSAIQPEVAAEHLRSHIYL